MSKNDNQRWAIELRGEAHYLALAVTLFEDGKDIVVTTKQVGGAGRTILVSPKFNHLTKPRDVTKVGLPLLSRVNGILYLHDRFRQPIGAGGVFELRDDGRTNIVLIAEPARFQTIFHPPSITQGSGATPEREQWIALANTDSHVADLLNFLSGNSDWVELYKAYETIERKHRPAPALPSAADLNRFTMTAQFAQRHSPRKMQSPTQPKQSRLSLEEAQEMIRTLATEWLRWKSTGAPT